MATAKEEVLGDLLEGNAASKVDKIQKSDEFYRRLERDNRIRDIMISKRFALLKHANLGRQSDK
jgi:hypothetical protein